MALAVARMLGYNMLVQIHTYLSPMAQLCFFKGIDFHKAQETLLQYLRYVGVDDIIRKWPSTNPRDETDLNELLVRIETMAASDENFQAHVYFLLDMLSALQCMQTGIRLPNPEYYDGGKKFLLPMEAGMEHTHYAKGGVLQYGRYGYQIPNEIKNLYDNVKFTGKSTGQCEGLDFQGSEAFVKLEKQYMDCSAKNSFAAAAVLADCSAGLDSALHAATGISALSQTCGWTGLKLLSGCWGATSSNRFVTGRGFSISQLARCSTKRTAPWQ
jgi:hypothetical protein